MMNHVTMLRQRYGADKFDSTSKLTMQLALGGRDAGEKRLSRYGEVSGAALAASGRHGPQYYVHETRNDDQTLWDRVLRQRDYVHGDDFSVDRTLDARKEALLRQKARVPESMFVANSEVPAVHNYANEPRPLDEHDQIAHARRAALSHDRAEAPHLKRPGNHAYVTGHSATQFPGGANSHVHGAGWLKDGMSKDRTALGAAHANVVASSLGSAQHAARAPAVDRAQGTRDLAFARIAAADTARHRVPVTHVATTGRSAVDTFEPTTMGRVGHAGAGAPTMAVGSRAAAAAARGHDMAQESNRVSSTTANAMHGPTARGAKERYYDTNAVPHMRAGTFVVNGKAETRGPAPVFGDETQNMHAAVTTTTGATLPASGHGWSARYGAPDAGSARVHRVDGAAGEPMGAPVPGTRRALDSSSGQRVLHREDGVTMEAAHGNFNRVGRDPYRMDLEGRSAATTHTHMVARNPAVSHAAPAGPVMRSAADHRSMLEQRDPAAGARVLPARGDLATWDVRHVLAQDRTQASAAPIFVAPTNERGDRTSVVRAYAPVDAAPMAASHWQMPASQRIDLETSLARVDTDNVRSFDGGQRYMMPLPNSRQDMRTQPSLATLMDAQAPPTAVPLRFGADDASRSSLGMSGIGTRVTASTTSRGVAQPVNDQLAPMALGPDIHLMDNRSHRPATTNYGGGASPVAHLTRPVLEHAQDTVRRNLAQSDLQTATIESPRRSMLTPLAGMPALDVY